TVSDFVHDDVNGIGEEDASVSADDLVRLGQGDAFAAVVKRAIVIADGIVHIQAGVIRGQTRGVVGDHHVTVGRDGEIRGKRELDAVGEPPAGQWHCAGTLVVKFDVFVPFVSGDRVIHDLVDDDVPNEQLAVGCAGC